jgi:uncharacterized repeat protein (TIGR03806 family)
MAGPTISIVDGASRVASFAAPPVATAQILKLNLATTSAEGNKSRANIEVAVVNENQILTVPEESYFVDERPSNTTCKAPPPPPSSSPAILSRVYPAINARDATVMVQAPGDGSFWYIGYRSSKRVIRFANRDDVTAPEVVLDLSAFPGVLHGIALHPQFATNGRIYVQLQNGGTVDGTAKYIEFTWSESLNAFDLGTQRVVLVVDSPHDLAQYNNHPGGTIAFGPDGYLYLGIGDYTRPGVFNEVSQDIGNLWGSILRIDVDSGTPYGIPPTNPFAVGGGRPEIYAWGFRHPWKLSFDRKTGEMWVGDVGWVTREEVDVIRLGGNYGWPLREGTVACPDCPINDTDHGYDLSSMTEPVHDYGRGVGKSVTGGYVYRGSAIPDLQGVYVFGDFVEGKVFGLQNTGDGQYARTLITQEPIGLVSFAEDLQGELYALDFNGGGIYKLLANDSPTVSEFPARLSETGCVNVDDPEEVIAGMIPFTVQLAFWSDGAAKSRWLALPDGVKISQLLGSGGDLDLPIGTVLVKHFRLFNRLIETRLFMRHEDGQWAGYSYEWDDSESEAYLLEGAKEKDVNGQTWRYPSRAECLQCHTEAAGRSLGLTSRQLNTFLSDGERLYSQLQMFRDLSLFDFSPDKTRVFAAMDNGDASLGARARSYLDVNCSGCHQPDGNAGRATMDLRIGVPLQEMDICDIEPKVDNLGNLQAKLLRPGDPSSSIIFLRISNHDANRMPPIGSNELDQPAIELMQSWIYSLDQCS